MSCADVYQLDFIQKYKIDPRYFHLQITESTIAKNPDQIISFVIAMTANAFDEDRKAVSECDMNGFIYKPIDMDEVIQELKKVFGNSKTK